jgi:hypothetical protein
MLDVGRPGQNTYPLTVPELPEPEPEVPDSKFGSDCHYAKLIWVLRVIHSGTRTT